MAALFTTSELFRQILTEIARRPEVVEHLRREIEDAAPDHDFTATSLVKMQLLDSFMKETQRQIPSLGKLLSEGFSHLLTHLSDIGEIGYPRHPTSRWHCS
jgi:cytochrome P450